MNNLNDQEKSVLLAELAGWRITTDTQGVHVWHGEKLIHHDPYNYVSYKPFDLYDTDNMALAWRVLNWAYVQTEHDPNFDYGCIHNGVLGWWDNKDIWGLPVEEAQRAWLDKILALAIEAGMIEVE